MKVSTRSSSTSDHNDKACESKAPSTGHFTFEMLPQHIDKGRKKSFKCDVCFAMYKHSFSLKRHFIRAHVNYAYLCETDIVNCGINLQASPSVAAWKESGRADVDCNLDSSSRHTNSPRCNSKMIGLYACHSCILFFTQLNHLQEHVSKNHADEACTTNSSKRPRTKSPVPSVVPPPAKSSNKIRSLAASSVADRKWQHFSHTNPDDVGYFSTVSKQIADNLLNHVDGRLSDCSQQQQSLPNEKASTSVSSSVTSSLSSNSLRRSTRIQNPTSAASAPPQDISSSSSPSPSYPTPKLDLSQFNFAPATESDAASKSSVDDEEQAKLDYLHANDLQSKRNAPVVTILNDYKSFVKKNSADSSLKPDSISSSNKDPFNYICTICSCRSCSRVDFLLHWKNNHPDVNCSYVKVDPTNEVPSKLLLWRYNSPNGLLKSCSTANYPGLSKANTSVHCTKCQAKFQSVDLLHGHILECARGSSSTKSHEEEPSDVSCSKPDPWKLIQDNPLYVFKGSPSQFHSCPYCQRGFTYLANYRKHMKSICPVRMQMEHSQRVDSNRNEESTDEEKANHECYKCSKRFKSYFDLLKHRLSHKLMNDQSTASPDETQENGL